MISPFQFDYGNQQVQAQLIFNFNAVKDVIILQPFSLHDTLGDQMLLVKDVSATWVRLAGNKLLQSSAALEKNLTDFFASYDFFFNIQTSIVA